MPSQSVDLTTKERGKNFYGMSFFGFLETAGAEGPTMKSICLNVLQEK